MNRIILLAGALSATLIAACNTPDNNNDEYAPRQAGTGGTSQTDFDDRMDSRGDAQEAGYRSSGHGGTAHSSPGDSAPRTAGTAGTAQRDFDDRHDSDTSMASSSHAGRDHDNAPGTTTERPAGTSGTAQRNYDDRYDSAENAKTASTNRGQVQYGTGAGAGTSGSATSVSKGYGGSTGPTVANRDMRREDDKSRIGVTEASSRNRDDANAVIASWPSVAKQAAQQMISKYGQPDEVNSDSLCWKDNAPWKKTVVHREETDHNFPAPHKDVLEQKIEMRVPPEKFDELAQFDGSLSVNRTKGTVSVICDKEEMNFVALNLANEIVNGKRSVEDARAALAQAAMQVKNGQKPDLAQRLNFDVSRGGSGDPDTRDSTDASASGVTPTRDTTKEKSMKDRDDTIDRDHPNKPKIDEEPDGTGTGDKPESKDDLDKPGR